MVREYTDVSSARFLMHVGCASFQGYGIRRTRDSFYTFVYNNGPDQKVVIDEVDYEFSAGSLLLLVASQHFVFENPSDLIVWQFNREFYCIVDHDAEVGCVGFLFYGIRYPMFIPLDREEQSEIMGVVQMFIQEWSFKDNFRGEMLRTILKYLIIKTTRIAKSQSVGYQVLSADDMDIVRKFSLALEKSYKTEHAVAYYANELNKSPKTLSNIFALLEQPSPSKIIFNRIILEAKRYFHYSGKSAKEIAYELGFENPTYFSRFFKAQTGMSISNFKMKLIAHKSTI